MASGVYNNGKARLLSGSLALMSDAVKAMLVGPGYTPNPDHNFVSELVAHELSGAGYVGGFGGAGRKTLTGKNTYQDDALDIAYFDALVQTWPAINAGTASWVVLMKEVSTDANSPLLAWIDINDTVTVGTTLTVTWSPQGLLRIA